MPVEQSDYNGAFAVINPDAPGVYTFAMANVADEEGNPAQCVVLLIETETGSERHFWPIALAKQQHMILGELLKTVVEPEVSGLTIARDIPTNLRGPNGQ